MSPSGPLAGRSIVVTRPQAQAAALAGAITAAGGQPLLFPLLEISPVLDVGALNEAVTALSDYALVIFISPNAVAHAVPTILARGPWPATAVPAAVGPGTVKALLAHGVTGCLAPAERFDSEALLALPELAASRLNGKRALILRGDGGRELLADTLRQRGAQVDCVTCYRRGAPTAGTLPLLTAWRAGQLDALTVSSSEALRYLLAMLDDEGRDFLQKTPLFVPHARIAETARVLGLDNIVLTEAADAGILAALLAYNWSP